MLPPVRNGTDVAPSEDYALEYMKPLLILTLGTALAAGACTTTASDTADASLGSVNGEAARTPARVVRPAYRDVTIPAGTTLPLALTSAVASDSSAVAGCRHG